MNELFIVLNIDHSCNSNSSISTYPSGTYSAGSSAAKLQALSGATLQLAGKIQGAMVMTGGSPWCWRVVSKAKRVASLVWLTFSIGLCLDLWIPVWPFLPCCPWSRHGPGSGVWI